jgi:hypothetical protein
MHSFRCVIHKCKHTFTHQRHSRVRTLYVYVYECVYVGCMCMYVCVNTYKHVCVHTYKHVIHKCKRTVAAHVCSYTVARVLVQHLCSCTLLCVSMCVYVCVYTCLCVSMFVCIHTHTTVIRTYIHSGMCMCACVYVYVRSCMTDICVRMDTHTYTHIQVCTCMHAHIQTYIHPLTHTYTKIHTHTHAYIDTCIQTYNCSPTAPRPPPHHTQVALTQSMAIILFLEDAFPHCGPALLGGDVLTRATVTEMAEIINSGIQPLQVLG